MTVAERDLHHKGHQGHREKKYRFQIFVSFSGEIKKPGGDRPAEYLTAEQGTAES
jgi:hypothetical protein